MRVGITGPSRCGKSTLQRRWASNGVCLSHTGYCPACEEEPKDRQPQRFPRFCTDPIHLVKDPEPGVAYVPRDVEQQTPDGDLWSSCSLYVATHFLTRPGPWILEGVGLPRALRKWRKLNGHMANYPGLKPPLDKLIVLRTPRAPQLPGQIAQGKGLLTVLDELLPWLEDRIEWR